MEIGKESALLDSTEESKKHNRAKRCAHFIIRAFSHTQAHKRQHLLRRDDPNPPDHRESFPSVLITPVGVHQEMD